jgi:hypothetical protein
LFIIVLLIVYLEEINFILDDSIKDFCGADWGDVYTSDGSFIFSIGEA